MRIVEIINGKSRNSSYFMETEGILPCPHPEPDAFSPQSSALFP